MDPNDELSAGFICVDHFIQGSKDRKIRNQNAPCHHCIVDHDLGSRKIHLQTAGDQNHSLMVGDHKRIDMTNLILFESKEYSPVIHSRELILKYMFKNSFIQNFNSNVCIEWLSRQISLQNNHSNKVRFVFPIRAE